MLALDFVLIEVGGRRAVLDSAKARRASRVEKELRDDGRLAGVIVSDKGDVSNLRTGVDLHMDVLAWGC